MSTSDFMTIVGYPVTLFNRLITWWGSISIAGFTLWQWILSFFLVGIAIVVLRVLLGNIPRLGIPSKGAERRTPPPSDTSERFYMSYYGGRR